MTNRVAKKARVRWGWMVADESKDLAAAEAVLEKVKSICYTVGSANASPERFILDALESRRRTFALEEYAAGRIKEFAEMVKVALKGKEIENGDYLDTYECETVYRTIDSILAGLKRGEG